jgi:uncharacterized repeat protein (TIGR02543 family)
VNADGKDEIVAAGYTGIAKCDNGTWSGVYDRDKDNYAVSTAFYDGGKYDLTELTLLQMNNFTKNHTEHIGVSHYTWPVASVACAAINGDSSADEVFISGTLYTWQDGVLNEEFKPEYFGKSFDTIDGMTNVWDHWVDSVAVGNFDGNDAGRQQIIFTVCAINTDSKYIYKAGIIGGNEYKDVSDATGVKSYGTVASYYSSNIQDDGFNLYGGDGKHNSWWDDGTPDPSEILNCVPVAIDCDNDGVMAKYDGKGYVYTDPSVLAVLQAAPYFGELGPYSDFAGTTSYSVTTSYTYGKTSSDNVSFGFGFAGDFEFPFVQASVEAGYTLNWSKSFENSLTTTYTSTFTAGPYDQVVLQRTPALVYSYSVMKSDGTYAKSAYQFTVPLKPVYTKLSVDEYNNFVDYYDAWYKTNITDSSEAVQKDPSVLLNKMSTELLPDKNEGDPSVYRSDWSKRSIGSGTNAVSDNAQSLSKGEYNLDHSGGSTSSEWEVESSSTKTITTNHGFHFSLTVQTGPKLLGTGFGLGAYANLDYSHGTGHYTTNTSAAGATGTVGDIDSPALEAKGIPASISNAYGFTWSFGKWEGDLGGVCLDNGVRDASQNPLFDGNVPFFGYAVSSISMPPAPVTTLTAELATAETAALSWTAPAARNVPGYSISGYNVFKVDNGTYTQLNSTLLTGTAYTVALEKSNSDYTFVVTTVSSTGESVWSNMATVTTPKKYYTLTMTGQVDASAGYEGVSVTNGGKCPEDTIVYVSATALNGYALIGYKIGNAAQVTFDPCESKSLNFRFPSADTTIVFTTKQVSSDIHYASSDDNAGGVEAFVGSSKLAGDATVTSPVTFRASAKSGYVLTKWTILDSNNNSSVISDDGSGVLTLNPVKSGYSVTADFESTGAAAAQKTVTITPPSFGTVEVTDSSGTPLTPNSNGEIKAVVNSYLTFTAVPAQHYSLTSWTGGALSGTVNPQTVKLTGDITVGADFSAPVEYKVVFAASPAAGGSVSAENGGAPVASGDPVASGSDVVFTAVPNAGYAFDGWTVNGTANSSASDTITLTVSSKTNVTAAFAAGYTISASAGTGGTITPSGNSSVKSGGGITYAITPNAGYNISDVTVDGQSVGAVSSYRFSGVSGNHSIAASFVSNGGGTGGSTGGVTGGGSAAATYTLTFSTNGGSSISSVTAASGATVDLSAYAPSRSGYAFSGWYSDSALTAKVSSVKLTANTTVYAGWTEKKDDIPFSDIPDGAYYRDAVGWAVGKGVTNGSGTNTFDPDGICTRAQAVTFLWRAAGSPAPQETVMPFADVPAGSYYYEAVLWAAEQGVTKGTGATAFSPDLKCSRAHIVTFLWRADGSKTAAAANPFADVKDGAYYAKAVLWAVGNKITNGVSASAFGPDNGCTRAQIVTFIYRDMNR